MTTMTTAARVGATWVAMLLLLSGLGAQEQLDREMIAKIKAEGYQRSQVEEVFNHLVNIIGPRLTNSSGFRTAVDYVQGKLEGYGLSNVHVEPWEFGRGWTLEKFSVEMLRPRYAPLVGYPRAWSPSTSGRLISRPVYLGGTPSDAWAGRVTELRGAIVLTQPIQEDFVREDRQNPRADYRPAPPAPTQAADAAAQQARRDRARAARREGSALLRDAGVGAVLEPNIGEHGTIFVTGRDLGDDGVPTIVMASEHYNLIARLAEQGIPVELAVDLQARYDDEDTDAVNVIAEIPGTDPRLAGEVVMVGAHLDSWHSATGSTDNADGSSVSMEALRILNAVGARPRRTIRMALWSGEEQGLLGSREYVRRHLEGEANTSERERFSVYFNLDNGYVPIYGFYMEGNEEMKAIMDAYLRPFHDDGATYNTLQGIGSTDHLSFLRAGVPGYQAIHDYTDYDVRTHHTNVDTFERVDGEALKQAAVVMASILYHAAMRDERMPRDPGWRPLR